MHIINNEKVKINDLIYDITNGEGRVVGLSDGAIEVRFNNGRRISFDQHGMLNGTRRLYWHYPVLIDPPKSLNDWEYVVRVVKAIVELLSGR